MSISLLFQYFTGRFVWPQHSIKPDTRQPLPVDILFSKLFNKAKAKFLAKFLKLLHKFAKILYGFVQFWIKTPGNPGILRHPQRYNQKINFSVSLLGGENIAML